MTKTKFNRYYQCAHCGETHVKRRANQKFCSTRCRSGHWAMNQPKKQITKKPQLEPISGSKSFRSDVVSSSVGSGLALWSQHLIQLAEGNSPKDIVRNQKDLAKNQFVLSDKLDAILKHMKGQSSKVDNLLNTIN